MSQCILAITIGEIYEALYAFIFIRDDLSTLPGTNLSPGSNTVVH